ncbi:hypothetical protein HDV05_007743 [Chytridiales sp. JEL 0842]|nr:hypothetical protein HDV05_007743 [Chytridiales sp. JEL 0842]
MKDVMYYVTIYGILGLSIVIANNIHVLVFSWGSLHASDNIHRNILNAVLGSPLRFFEVTPMGRILNRFSKDLSSVDNEVMRIVSFFFFRFFQAFFIIIVIGFGSWPFLLAISPIVFIYKHIARLYLNASRELKRLESVSRSPLYSNFSETLNGVSTIRAYGQSDRFISQNQDKTDFNHRSFYLLWAANRWLCLRTDLISATVLLIAGATVIFGGEGVSPGWAGLILLYANQFSDAILWLVRSHAEMEMGMNAVERTIEYSNIPQEPAGVVESYRPPAHWPDQGVVEVRNVSVKYSPELPFVLKDLTFSTKRGEKIGVVGRTGAGKSTLSLCMFRILPIAKGSIHIDGYDINRMGLHDLRSRLTMIPQDPVLFTGTIRSNLDPLNEHSDEELWRVLKSTHVLESLQRTPSSNSLNRMGSTPSLESGTSESNITLDSPVAENGQNFSQGQRQLLCMARALLRDTKVIFLDEATASIDSATDTRIQKTIREELDSATIFCIAHRLRTVVDFDRIIVLDHGSLIEFGTPLELMMIDPDGPSKSTSPVRNVAATGKVTQSEQEPIVNGHFRRMCEDTGEFDELVKIARESRQRKLQNNECLKIARKCLKTPLTEGVYRQETAGQFGKYGYLRHKKEVLDDKDKCDFETHFGNAYVDSGPTGGVEREKRGSGFSEEVDESSGDDDSNLLAT